MAKKKNAKQLREEQKNAKMQKIQAVMKAKQEKIMAENKPAPPVIPPKKDRKKSLAKASGSKVNLVVGDEIVMATYGDRCLARLDHKITPSLDTEPLTVNPSLSNINASDGMKINFEGRISGLSVVSDNPLHFRQDKPVGSDLLCLKDKLEQWYFGKNFNDNIHIQIIYHILDIEKILAVHANNIVFALDNILHPDTPELNDDFIGIGYMRATNTLNDYKNFCQSKNKQSIQDHYTTFQKYINRKELLYFGESFYHGNKRREEDIYNILALISSLRQFCFHSTSDSKLKNIQSDWLYRLDEQLSPEFKNTLDTLWKEIIENFDRKFLEQNTVNLHILCELFGNEKQKDIINAYYDFLMRKSFKNMGFSVKKLRECMLEESALAKFKDDSYNSVRHKLYQLFDFIIAYHYQKNPELTEILVSSLRCCLNDDEKEQIYIKTAKEMTGICKDYFYDAAESVNAKNIQSYHDKSKIYHETISDKISGKKLSLFSELIYMLTLLVDGKEINDLLTTLINKFDNIISFLDILRNLNIDAEFKDEYKFFSLNNCIKIANELRTINSVARMQKPSANAKKVMFRDALRILGMDNRPDEEIDKEINRTMPVDADGKFIKGKQNFRNFIASNVIESSRFRYLVRYNNPHKTRALIQNQNVVKFVLRGIPDTQIKRYFDVCKDKTIPDTSDKSAQIDVLAGILTNINYKVFKDVPQKARINKDDNSRNREDALKKQRYQAVVTLYLTVLYLITKNLVYVNSRYVMAFHYLEHNANFYEVQNLKDDYRELTRKLLNDPNYQKYGYLRNQKGHRKWHVLVSKNLANSDKTVTKYFRDVVAHISVVRNINDYIGDVKEFNSYFELYHYLLQKIIKHENKYDPNNAQTVSYLANLDKYNVYCKDFVKAYCVPFGYNVPRYKNLTINELFDRNNPLPEPKDDKIIRPHKWRYDCLSHYFNALFLFLSGLSRNL